MDEIGIERARQTLGDLVDRARYAGDHTTITRQNKQVAVIVPVEWYEQAKAALKERDGT